MGHDGRYPRTKWGVGEDGLVRPVGVEMRADATGAQVYDENSGEWVESGIDVIACFGDHGSLLLVHDGGRTNAFALPGASQRLLYAVHQAARARPDHGLSGYGSSRDLSDEIGRLLETPEHGS